MSENDLPAAGTVDDTPLSIAQGEEAIGNLLDGALAGDLASEVSEQKPDAVQQDAGSEEDGELDGLVIDEEDAGGEPDASEESEFKGGRFASDDAKVKLEDGTTISVAELKRNNLFQRDYSKKTAELSEQRKQLETESRQFTEHVNSIVQQREVILTLAQELLPQEPVLPTDPNDPIAYVEYRQAKDVWDQKMGKLHGLWQAKQQEEQTLTQKQAQQQQQALESEKEKLFEAIPRLKDEAKRKAFLTDAVEIGTSVYGLTPQDIVGISDHRVMRVLADALAYRKAIAKRDTSQPAADTAQQSRQPRIPPQQRMSAQTPQQRDSRNAFERLRQSGSARDAEAALMSFIT